jgi:WD40 repeat protein
MPRRTVAAAFLTLCPFLLSCGKSTLSDQQPPTYDQWIAAHADTTLPRPFLVATLVEDSRSLNPSFDSFVRFTITNRGSLSMLGVDMLGAKGVNGHAGHFSPADLAALQSLLDNLPDDTQLLPPPPRRLLLQFTRDGQPLARVYDRANLSDNTLQLLRKSEIAIGSWTPLIKPDATTALGESEFNAGLAVTPDAAQIITVASGQPFRVWDAATHDPIASHDYKNASASALIFSPDGVSAIAQSGDACERIDTASWNLTHRFEPPEHDPTLPWYSDPVFTTDGRYLLLRRETKLLTAIDTTSWKTVPLPGFIPPTAAAYHPSSDLSRALVELQNRDLVLWNVSAKRPIATLAAGSHHWHSAFSPNGQTLALAYLPAENTHAGTGYSLTLFRTSDGLPLHTLLCDDIAPFYTIEAILWTPDSNHLLVAGRNDGFFTNAPITLFNPSTGRQEATLATYSGRALSLALLPDNHLVANLQNTSLAFYDLPHIYSQLTK